MQFFFPPSAAKLRSRSFLATVLCVVFMPCLLSAQDDPGKAEARHEPMSYASIRLVNRTQSRDVNELQNTLRNMLPRARVDSVSAQSSISLLATAADLELARKMVAELDQPRKSYRATFTLTEVEAGKRGAVQRYAVAVLANERGELKQGQRIPIATATAAKGDETPAVQVQYQDVGLRFEVLIDGATLRTTVEQSASLAPNSLHPAISLSLLEASSKLKLNVPIQLGAMAEPGTARHLEVELLVEPVE